ncbi:MAG: nicotinate-nucleotide--dimethylbenzimidazole phosphoribosyltransferase [Elusimicrobia bacterium]|nr:nicotinate-nucleotide--dimethylbenzimidazole phosphoribosyltransferase [Elusimicrobiota bacterium]
MLNEKIKNIQPLDKNIFKQTQNRLDNLTKPQGSLGRLEELAKQITAITEKENPVLEKKTIFTLAGDHGIVDEGVSAYPKEVTLQMVYNFIKGGAGINVLAKHIGAKVVVADLGVASKLQITNDKSQRFRDKKINYGTKNFAKGPAMSKEEAVKSIETGMELVEEELAGGVDPEESRRDLYRIDIIGTGDMGIGNTTPSSAITSVICSVPVEEVTGRGTGINDKALKNKISAIKKGIEINKPDAKNGIDVLSKVGGYEIGGLAGIILAGAIHRIPVVIDGFISGAAALLAYTIQPITKDYLIASHCSVEQGHSIILKHLGLKPILDLNLRLGEGTGAALAISIAEASCKILTQMATFQNAGVSTKN